MHTPILIVPPTSEPLTLDEAKLHCRVDSTADDNLVQRLIRAARMEAERLTGRAICASTWQINLDRFPYYDGSSPRQGAKLGVGAYEYLELRRIRLPRPPAVAVLSINYVDTAGNFDLLATDQYLFSNLREPATIEPSYGNVWPVNRYQADAVQVQWQAGWPCTTIGPVISTGSTIVTPASMASIVVGSVLTIDLGATSEQVVVTAVTATTFTATFSMQHLNAPVKCCGVPDDILSGMLLLIGHWYTNREAVTSGQLVEVPQAAIELLGGNNYGEYP
jgi:hypothetical protein